MSRPASTVLNPDFPAVSVVLELLKPITWFPPMWAFACGVVSAGTPLQQRWPVILAGLVLCGPLLCATSQAANDWFDRTVDAINEPTRPIPSGRMPGRSGLYVAVLWSMLSMACAAALGLWVFVASAAGLICAWAYSAPPIRLKQNGWWGNLASAACYEGLAWVTGAVVASGGAAPSIRILGIAALYSAGAHGIMTLNDFKSIEGDRRMGIGSLPVRLGAEHAGEVACVTMALPQLVVAGLLAAWGRPHQAAAVAALLGAQLLLMRRLLANPRERAPWYNGTGVSLFVAGMMVSAFALKSLAP
jgi:chlorophyll/bacteriochlorophyll a synthase